MILLNIKDIKQFTYRLFSDNDTAFDQFLLCEGTVVSDAVFSIDGHINKDYFSREELDQFKYDAASLGRIFSEEMLRWDSQKHYFYSFIIGKKTPLSFKFIFYLAPENVEKFVASLNDPHISSEDISGLVINIKFDGSHLVLTTGCSLKIFTLDKSVENAFDTMVKKFISSLNISYEI